MCGRFFMDPEEKDVRDALEKINRSPLKRRFEEAESALTAGGEVRPGDVVPALALSRTGSPGVFPMRWGYRTDIDGKSRLIINARSETAGQKPLFRDGLARRRCLLPMSRYFEWARETAPDGRKRAGRKYAVTPRSDGPVLLAGLYRMEMGLPVFVVLTRDPSRDVAFLHDRMPVLLRAADADIWLNGDVPPEETLLRALTRVEPVPA